MKIYKRSAFTLCVLILALFSFGCGGNSMRGRTTMEIPELDISMTIPAGWELDNPQLCFKENNTGLMMEEEMTAPSFEESAAQLSREFGSKVTSTTSMEIGGYKAIRTTGITPDGNVLLRLYINKDGRIGLISFIILQGRYAALEKDLQESFNSIQIKP